MHLYGPGWFGHDLDGSLFEGPDGPAFLEESGPARRFDYQTDPLGLRPLERCLDSESLDQTAQSFLAEAEAQKPLARTIEASPREREELARRLKDLGYL